MENGKNGIRKQAAVWEEKIIRPSFPTLRGDLKTDVLIIGGGLAGILCAYMLQEQGIQCALVEAERICSGVTGRTTAKITFQHGLIYDRLIRSYGVERAQMYLQANRAALDYFRKLCAGNDCDYMEQDQYVYSVRGRERLERECRALDQLGITVELVDRIQIPVSADGAVRAAAQAQFHPLKFAFALAEKLKIYENTRILALERGGARTENGKITAEKIIVATHFPFLNMHGFYFLKQYQHRSYVLTLDEAEKIQGMYVDERDDGLSFRTYQDVLLLGGGGHRTGKQGGGWRELTRFASKHYPDAQEITRWATQDCMTLDRIPYIGQYGRFTPDRYVLTGFNKWGMTSAMAGAMILRDQIMGRENPWAEIFTPWRRMMHPQLIINSTEAVIHLITPTTPRCTHMGCALKYNPQEHSWDCPCHGSRFTEDGKVMENPANKNKKE